jgi:hypothetical protein
MGTIRRFNCEDLLRFNAINMDVLTETVRGDVLGRSLGTWDLVVERARVCSCAVQHALLLPVPGDLARILPGGGGASHREAHQLQ